MKSLDHAIYGVLIGWGGCIAIGVLAALVDWIGGR